MKGNDLKNRSGQLENNVRPVRQQEGRPERRQTQGNGQPQQQNRQWRNDNYRRDGQGYKSYNRDNRESRDSRDSNFKSYNSQLSSNIKNIKTEETIEDIMADLERIEKEIELEIKQISTLRLGV